MVHVVVLTVPSCSIVVAQLDNRVVADHVPQSKPIVVCVGSLSLEVLQVNVELLRFLGGDQLDLLETQEKTSLQEVQLRKKFSSALTLRWMTTQPLPAIVDSQYTSKMSWPT